MLFRFSWRDCFVTLDVLGLEPWSTVRRLSTLLALPVVALTGDEAEADVDIRAQELTNSVWLLENDSNCQWYECWDDMVANLIAQMSAHFIRRTQLLLLHAAAWVREDRLVICAGPSRVGKSSLALSAWLAGWEFLTDDVLAITPCRHLAMTFPKALKPRLKERAIPPPLSEMLPEEHRLVGKVNGEFRLLIGRNLPRMTAHDRQYPLERLYLVERTAAGPSRVESLDRDEALRGLLAQVLTNRSTAPMEGVRLLKDWLARGEVLRLWLGEDDLERAVALMLP